MAFSGTSPSSTEAFAASSNSKICISDLPSVPKETPSYSVTRTERTIITGFVISFNFSPCSVASAFHKVNWTVLELSSHNVNSLFWISELSDFRCTALKSATDLTTAHTSHVALFELTLFAKSPIDTNSKAFSKIFFAALSNCSSSLASTISDLPSKDIS